MRPAWSAGTAVASPIPVSWHIRQLSRPSSVWGVSDAGVGAGAGTRTGAGAGVGAGVGSGAGAGAPPPPQAMSNGNKTIIATVSHKNTGLIFILYTP